MVLRRDKGDVGKTFSRRRTRIRPQTRNEDETGKSIARDSTYDHIKFEVEVEVEGLTRRAEESIKRCIFALLVTLKIQVEYFSGFFDDAP